MPIATETGGGELQLPPVGAHPARCVHIIDLGTQKDTFQGKPKIIRKVRINWELPLEKAVFVEERGEEPFMCGADYTLSLNERANLRHMLESWRGREFTADELKAFDLKVLLGKSCLVNILHKMSAKKRKYAIVATVSPLPKGMQCPKASLPKLNYDIEMGPNVVFDQLPEWIQDKIKASVEFTDGPTQPDEDDTGRIHDGEDPDEIPF